jgi:hypothetical protein
MPGIVPDARTASSGIEADSHSPEALFQAEQRGDELLLTAATGSRGGAAEAWRLTRASDGMAYEIQRRKRHGWTTMLRVTSGREAEKRLHQLAMEGDFAWTSEDVWSFIDDNPLVVQDRRDDGLRWIDKHGYIHRQPAGTRSRLPLDQS